MEIDMTDTTKRDRKITGIGHGDGSAFGLALAILITLGIKDTVELNKYLDGGDFGSVTDDAPLNGIETPELYPDRVLLLEDGTLLIHDGAVELAVGGTYSDEVMVSATGEKPATYFEKTGELEPGTLGGAEMAGLEEGERDEEAEQEAVEADDKPAMKPLA